MAPKFWKERSTHRLAVGTAKHSGKPVHMAEPVPGERSVLLIKGPSRSGKSVLLNSLTRQVKAVDRRVYSSILVIEPRDAGSVRQLVDIETTTGRLPTEELGAFAAMAIRSEIREIEGGRGGRRLVLIDELVQLAANPNLVGLIETLVALTADSNTSVVLTTQGRLAPGTIGLGAEVSTLGAGNFADQQAFLHRPEGSLVAELETTWTGGLGA